MASSSDNRFVMGYPSMNNNYHPQAPSPGYAIPCQPGHTYPPQPPPPPPPYNSYLGTTNSKEFGCQSLYPPPQQPIYNSYASHSFNVWYGSQNHGTSGWTPEEDSGKKFGRIMLVTMVTLIISMCMVSLVIWLLFGTQVPEFRVTSFSVSNFKVSDSMIMANWDVNVTVFNPNTDLKVNFTSTKASVFYKNFPLAMSAIEPFYLQGSRSHRFQFKLDNEKAMCRPIVAREINGDQSSGILFLSLRLRSEARLSSNSVWRKETLRVFCEDLKVNFGSDGRSGMLTEDAQTECIIFN